MQYLQKFKLTNKKSVIDKILKKWKIINDDIKNRYDIIKDYEYTKYLLKMSIENKIYNDQREIISWLDSLSIIYKMNQRIDELNKNIFFENIDVIQEYCIPFFPKRADYLLIQKNKIIILEFSFEKWMDKDYQYNTKLNQVIGYKELLSNLLPKNIEIGTYTFLIKPTENDSNSNDKQIDNLISYIEYFFKDKTTALNELEKL